MRVFIAEFDLFRNVGGGQTAYQRLIERNPDIEFHYIASDESPRAKRPPNAHVVSYREAYRGNPADKPLDTYPPHWAYRSFLDANNIAALVAGQEFDVVELADFRSFGSMLPSALSHHGVRCGRTVLSLHGRLSTSLKIDWETPDAVDRVLDARERLQYQAVDTRYGISHAYLTECRAMGDLESHYLDPLRIVQLPQPTLSRPSIAPPNVNFIGRTEKRKGPDVFLELVWWLPRELFGTANIIGPESYTDRARWSNAYLHKMRRNRLKDVAIRPAMTQAELADLFAGRSITVLPSRYDTLNLVALESLFAGCPTAVGDGAGVCRFLEESFPDVPFIKMDLSNFYSCIPEVSAVLRDYDQYRERLVEAVRESRPTLSGLTLEEIYRTEPNAELSTRALMDEWYQQLKHLHERASSPILRRIKGTTRSLAKVVMPRSLRNKVSSLRKNKPRVAQAVGRAVRNAVITSAFGGDAVTAGHAIRCRRLASRYQNLMATSEQLDRDLNRRVQVAWSLADEFRLDRTRIWTEIARLERARGNDLHASTFDLRVMRAVGEDRLGMLPAVVAGLRKCGFPREAQTAQAMYGPAGSRLEDCRALLDTALSKHASNPDRPLERIDDRRETKPYRVSIVVSLYNAADKLAVFLSALQSQTLIRRKEAEVVLVDSGSPSDEYGVFRQCMRSLDIPIVYARSSCRETIYSAWNRGINLARAPYLTFLGVDEMALPRALELLAGELDRDPALDWVAGSSLVSEVDQHGTCMRDVMTFDRRDYKPTMTYLDICYLTYVGGLYRRSIHDRLGYYDASFKAAGDTEFKMRILPFIKTKVMPQTLGIFWNYSDGRTTESPLAEVEDLRAWYLHRSLAGVQYAFDGRDPQEAVELFRDCLGYRKSFCIHTSTDVEHARNVAVFLREQAPDLLAGEHAQAIEHLLATYRSLDRLPLPSRWTPAHRLMHARRLTATLQERQRRLAPPEVDPKTEIFNDNRYEQHWQTWKSATHDTAIRKAA